MDSHHILSDDFDNRARPAMSSEEDDSVTAEVMRWWEDDTSGFAKYPVDPRWIDLDIVRGWIDTCISDHGSACWALDGVGGTPGPLWLIDVDFLCLVPASRHHSYLALSYVWGDVPSSETTTANLKAMQEPGALSSSKFNADIVIPKTITHAIGLVQVLGERYLWVDRFCICQDDEEAKSAQISIMGDIYNNSLVTIIAASGWDADHGLRGIKGVTEPRGLSPNMGDDYVKSLQPQSAIWYSRGWTFQELYMSKRKLMFHYQAVIWECGEHVWHEIHGCQSVGRNCLPQSLTITPSHQIQDLVTNELLAAGHVGAYYGLVNAYNSRDLSFPTDASRAFAGVMSILSKTVLPRGLFWGIPIDFFDAALLWIPQEPMKRRQPEESTALTWPDPPSWSWLGWQGRVRDDNWRSKEYRGSPDAWQTLLANLEPECEWRYMDHDEETLELLGPQTGGNLYSPSLRTRVRVGNLRILSAEKAFISGVETRMLRLRTRFDEWITCGVLLGDVSGLGVKAHMDIKCIVLSRSRGSLAPSFPTDNQFAGEQQYYNILWVEPDGDVLYRKGIGRVIKSLWDEHIGGSFQDIRLC